MRKPSTLIPLIVAVCVGGGAALAQSSAPASGSNAAVVDTPPSVDNGVANGSVKRSGSPSVSNGVSNGIVKQSGSPSVGDGIANGVVKSPTVQQTTQ